MVDLFCLNSLKMVELLSTLPPEIVTKILLHLPNNEIFGKCALVCKRWNAFVKTSAFWQALILLEFGREQVTRCFPSLSKNDGGWSSSIDQIRRFLAFVRCQDAHNAWEDDYFVDQDSPPSWQRQHNRSINEKCQVIGEFLKKIRAAEKYILESPNAVYRKYGFGLLDLSQFVPFSDDTTLGKLRFRLAIRSCRKEPFYLLDSDFNLMATLDRYNDQLWSIAVPKLDATCFLATKQKEFQLCFLLPSDAERYSRFSFAATILLTDTARSGQVTRLRDTLNKRSPCVNGTGSKRPLVEAAKNGQNEAISVLLKAGANLELTDRDNCTPLQAAIMNGMMSCVDFLLTKCGVKADDGAFVDAVSRANLGLMKLLLKNGASIHAQDGYARNAVHFLVSKFCHEHTDEEIERIHEEFDEFDEILEQLKQYDVKKAVIDEYSKKILRALEFVVANGCDVNVVAEIGDDVTPLMIACRHHDLVMIDWLLNHGADVNVRSEGRMSALLCAVSSNSSDHYCLPVLVVKMLLDHGACDHLEFPDDENRTPLVVAMLARHDYLANVLIDYGANVNPFGWPDMLNECLGIGHVEIGEMLIKAGADVNWVGNDGATTLMMAVPFNAVEIIEMLLQRGVNVNARDNKGQTALMGAVQGAMKPPSFWLWLGENAYSKSVDVVETLIRNGADTTIKDFSGQRAVDFVDQISKHDNAARVLELLSKV